MRYLKTGISSKQERLKQASVARAREISGQEIVYAGTAEPTDDEIAKYLPIFIEKDISIL